MNFAICSIAGNGKRVHAVWSGVLRAGGCAAALAIASAAHAATFTVDTTIDDGSAPFQICDSNDGNCSLRGAITKANASGGADDIDFAIPASDSGYIAATQHWRIAPATELPLISDDLVVDGYTQPGATPNTLAPDQGGINAVLAIELHGPGGSTAGLTVGNGSPRLTVRGLAINRFGINLGLYSPGPHHIEGCFLGTDITGLQGIAANGNSIGIRQRGEAVIGGTTPAARNVISGNGYIGLWDESGTTTAAASSVQGNLIGLAADGVTVLPGQDYGVYLSGAAPGGLFGGDSVAARNVFAGNELGAFYFTGNTGGANAPATRIQGNVFGTDWSGTLARPNGANSPSPSQPQPTIAVFRGGSCGIAIGGNAEGEGNLIANGAAAGVHIATCTGAAIQGNAFRGNRIGIDLSASSFADGITPNDAGDADSGGNRLQNVPTIDSAVYSGDGATLTLTYRIDSTPANAVYPLRVDIARGFGRQALATVLSDSYTSANAQLPRSVNIAVNDLLGQPVVLSVTDAEGNTSEFSSDGIFSADFE